MEENAIGMPDSFFERLNKKNGFADDTTAAPVDSGTTPVATDKTIPSGMPDSFFEKLNSQQHYADTNNWAENYKRYIPQAEENPSAWDNIKNNFFAIKDASEASMYGGLELMSRQGEKSGNANFANFIKAAGMYYGADPNWLVKNMQENEAQSQEELKRVWLDPKMGQFNATDMFADPKSFFQTQLPQMLGGSATLMAAGMGIAKGVQTGVMALGAAGAPFTFGGSAVAAGFIGGAVASAISRPIESLMEGYGAFDEAYSELAKKYPNATHQQLTDMAMPVFNKTFDENMQLQVLDAVQLGLSIIPVTAWGKGALSGTGAIGRMARRADMMRQRYNVAAHIGETAFQMGTGGWEEVRQMQITNEAINKYVGTDKPTSWYDMLNTKEGQSAVSGGSFMGGMMEAPGMLKLAYNKLTGVGDDIKTKPYEDIKQKQTALFYGNIAKSVNEGTTNEMMQAINKFGRSGVLATVETDDADSRNKSSIAEAKRLGDEVAEQVGVFSRMKEQYPDVSEKGLVRMFQNNALIRNNANALKTLSEDNVTDAPIIQRINAQNEALNKENNDIIAGKDVWETPSHEDPFADPEKDKEADIPFDSVEEVEAARLKEIEALQQIPTDGMTDEQMYQRAESLAEINSRYEDLKNRLTEKINDAKGHYENQRVLTEMLQNNIPVEGTIQKAYGMHYDFVTQDGKTVRFYNQATHDVVDDNDFNGSAFLVLRKAEQGLDGTYKDEKGNYLFRSVLGDKDHAERIEVHTTDKDGNDKYLGNVAVSNAEDYNIARDRAKAARMEKLEGEDGEGEGFSVSDEQLSGVKTTSNEQAAEAQSYGFRNAYHALNSVNKYFDADYTDYANIPKEDLALVGRIKQEEAASATTTTPPPDSPPDSPPPSEPDTPPAPPTPPPTPPPAPQSPSPASAPSGTTSSTDSGNAGYERTERSFDKVNVGDNITHNGKQGKVFAKVRPKGSLSHPVVLAKDAEGVVFRVSESEYKGTERGESDNVLKTNGKLLSYRNDIGRIVVDEENNVIFEGNKSSVELGKTTDEEFAAKSIGDIGISYVNENSLNQAILVDNTVYVKGEQQELVRINYDKNGNVVSYTYKNSKGQERTNRNYEAALDVAIQKNNQEFDKSRKGASDEVKQRDEEHISGVVKSEYGDSIGYILETMPDEVYDTFDLMESGVTSLEKDAIQYMVLRTIEALADARKRIEGSNATKKEKGSALSMIEKFEKDLNKYYGKLDQQGKVSAKDVAKANTGENNKGVNTVQDAEQKTEAYHADKAAGKETELVKAVEDLINKNESNRNTTTEVNPKAGVSSNSNEGNSALRAAESTAKALEGVDTQSLKKQLDIEANWDMIGEGDALSGKDAVLAYTQKRLPEWNRESQLGNINPNSKLTYDIVRGQYGGLDQKNIAEAKDENGVTIAIAKLDDKGGVEHIAVAPEFRGKGVADDLIKVLKENNPNLDLSKTKLRSKGFEKAFGNKIISEAYHKAKADGSNPELVKAVEDLLAPKVAPTTNTEGETQTTEAQLQEFGVPEQDVKPVTNVLTAMVDGLRKAGLTAAKTVGEFVGIGRTKQQDIETKDAIAEITQTIEVPKLQPVKVKEEVIETKTEQVSPTVNKITDVGEKIGGARKDLAEKLGSVTSEDIKSQPLSKVFPKPDFDKLISEKGISKDVAILLNYLYSKIPSKPRKSYQVSRWVDKVNEVIGIYRNILEEEGGSRFAERVIDGLRKSSTFQRDYNIYSAIINQLGFRFNPGTLEIKEFSRAGDGKKTFTIVNGRYIVKDYDTLEEAVNGLGQIVDAKKDKPKETKFDIYQDTKTKEYFVGKKGATGVNRIAEGFKTLKEARDFLKTNQEQLQETWDALRDIPTERRKENRDRKGIDWRKGKNVDAEEFRNTFGFRGVEFGNWVNQNERQQSINEAYDALMDLASVLKLSPKSISLGGELGFAFGARGSGKHNAHYEPDKIVINLTKTKGAGSVAHEWWHGIDNYFSRKRGVKTGYVTESPRQRITREGTPDESVRKEMIDAFKGVVDAIRNSKLPERSKDLDKGRSNVYWSTPIEMTARAFENFVIEKLAQTGYVNDYLANLKSVDEWIKDSKGAIDATKNYPYPLADETHSINEAYQNFFDTIQEREEGGRSILFQQERGQGSFEEKYGVTFEQVEKLFESDYKNIYRGLERTFEELGVQQENLGNAIGDFMAEKVSRDLPSKLPNKKEKWDKDDLPRDRSLNVKPIPTKVKKVDLKTQQGKIEALKPITSKDDLRPNMQGVFHDADKKVLVATDAHKMVVIKDPTIKKTFIQDVTGKVVGLGKEIDAKYPDYSVVIPESAPIKQKVNVQQMLDETAGLARASDFFVDKDHLGIAAKITIGDKEFFFNPRLFNEVLTVFAQQGDKEVELQLSKPIRALKIESGDVTAILMPVQGYDQTLDNSVPHKEIFRRDETVDEKRKAIQNEIEYLEKNVKEAEGKLKLANDAFRKADASNYKSLEWDRNYEQRKYSEAKAALDAKESELLGIDNPIQEQSDNGTIKNAIQNGEITEQEASNFIESANTDEVESVIEAIESKAESENEVELNEVVEEVDDAVKGKVKPNPKQKGIRANAQYRVESGKRLIEALKDFSKAKNKRQATTAIIHEIMHPTVEAIITGAKEGNAVGQKHTKTIVDEYNKANPDNKVTEEELIADNDKFVNGETTDKYRAVQEFIAEQWERYHQEGAKGFSKSFQEVLDAISEAFRSVYKSLTGKELTPELRKMFDDILGKEELSTNETTPTKEAEDVSSNSNEGNSALRDVESTANALEDKMPFERKRQEAINLLPTEKINYKDIKGIGDLSIYLNNPEALKNSNLKSAYQIYEQLKNGDPIKDKPYLTDRNELLDGQNRIAAQLALGYENVDVVKVGKDFFVKPETKQISEAYHKAKADGSNPELVKAVEELLDKPKETSPTPNSKGEGTEVKYQIEESRDEPLASVNPALAEHIRQRMQRLFPSVALFSDKASFEAAAKKVSKGVTFSSAYIGAAIKNMVYVDAEKALQHTEIHEYAHIYWDALPADHPLKTALLDKFGGNEEAAIDAIGRAGTIIMENELDIAKSGFFEKWLKKFWAAVKGVFTSKSIEQAFAERLLTNADEVTEENITSGVVKYMKMKSSAKYSELSEKAVKGIEKIIGKKISSLTFPEYYKHISTEIKPNDFKQWKMLSPQKFLEKMYGIVSPVSTLSPSNKAVFMKQYREYLDDYNWAENNVWTRFASGSMTLTVKEIEDLYMEAYKRKSYGTKDAVNFLADLYSKAVMYKNMQQEIKGDTFNKPFAKMSFDMMSGHEITDLSGSEFVSGKYSLLSPDRVKETILQGREKLYREVQRNATIKEDALKNDFDAIWKRVKDLKSDLRKIVDKTGTYFIDRNSSAYKALRGGTAADRALADLLDMHYKYESAYGGLSMEKGKYRVPVARMDFGGLAKKFGFKEGMRRYFAKPSKYDNVIIDVRSLGLSKPLMTLKQARQEMVKGSNAIYPFQMLKLTKKVDALTKEAYKQFNSGRHANGDIVTTEDLSGSRYGVSFVKDDESSEDLKVSMMLYHYANIENESYDLLSPYSMYIQKYLGRKDKPNMLKWVKMLDDDLIKGESPTSNLGVYAKYVQALTNYTHWLQLGFNIAGMPFNAFAGFAQSVREIGFRNTLRGLRRVIGSLTVGGGAGVVNAKAISIMEKLHIVSLSKDLEMSVTSKVGKHISKMAFLPVSFVEYINHAYSFIGAMDESEWERVKALPANASAEDYTKAMGGNERIDELHTLTQKINGAYSKYSRRGINKTAEGRALMQFKNWLPDVIFAHLTVSQLNEAGEDLYGEYQSGIATSIKNTVWNKTIIPMFKDKSIAQAKKNWETLSEHEQMQVGKAMRQLVILGGMALWIASLDDRDDKELKRMLRRAMGDVTYIFDVSNMQFLFDNTVPVFGTIKNLLGLVAEVFSTATGNPSVYEKRQGSHMRGDLKLPVMIENQTPVVNKISKLVNEGD